MRSSLRTVVVLLAVVLGDAAGAASQGQGLSADPQTILRVSDAIQRCVRGRMGTDAQVIVNRVSLFTRTPLPSGDIEVASLPGARIGGPIQFAVIATLGGPANRRAAEIGRVVADLVVRVPHVTAVRVLARGAEVTAADVLERNDEVHDVAIEPLPRAGDLPGSRAARHVAEGEVVSSAALVIAPAVRSGQTVRALVRVGGAEASAVVVAAQSGRRGALVRVVNPDTRKELRARVLGPDLVEVIHD